MKILTKEEERDHYNATLRGGTVGGVGGLVVGAAAVAAASARYPFFRNLTLPLKAFLVTSAGTFAGIVAADHASRAYEQQRNPKDREFREREKQLREAELAGKTFTQRAMEWGKKERYKIVGASWVASMATAFALVNRNKFLTGQQKLVQARVYAQFLTLGVLIASAAFEISDSRNDEGRWESVEVIDPNDPEHKRKIEKKIEKSGGQSSSDPNDVSNMWKDMVAAEESRMKDREDEEKRLRKKYNKPASSSASSGSKDKKETIKKSQKKDEEKGEEEGEDEEKKDDSEGEEEKEEKEEKKEKPKSKKKDSKK